MKNFKKFSTLFFLSVFTLSIALVSCSDKDDEAPAATPLTFDAENVEVAVGATVAVKVKDGQAPYTALEKEKEVATAKVEENTITITGVSKGKTTVVVTDSKQNTGTITVTVKDKGIDLDKEELKLKVDEEGVVTILGGKGPYLPTVEKEDIATASIKEDKLTVKGLKAGTTLVTVTGLDKMNIATLSVTVE